MRTRFSPWKSLGRSGILLRPGVPHLLVLLGLAGGACLLASLRSTAPRGVSFMLCTRLPQEVPLLLPAGTRLARLIGERVEPLDEFEVVSAPRVDYDGSRIVFSARRSGEKNAQIWKAAADGRQFAQMTHSRVDSVTPDFLPDGRIVFARIEEGTTAGNPRGTIFVLDKSGTAHRISFGNVLDLVDHVLDDGRILVRRVTPRDRRGIELALRPDGTEMERFLPRPESVSELPPTPVRSFAFAPGDPVDLGSLGEFTVQSVVRMESRMRPPVATSVVDEGMDHGWLLCLDVSRSDLGIDLARAHTARIVGAEDGQTLAQTPIEGDGSFFVEVPADRLLKVEIVDDSGSVLVRQGDGIWVRPNEHRGCIGCHEPRYLAPRNRAPLALLHQEAVSGPPQLISRRSQETSP